MPISTTEAFSKRHITRDDGVDVLSRPLVVVAAMEAGYHLATPVVDDAVASSKFPGQMTEEEFIEFCEKHKSSFVSAEEMAKAVVIVAPSNVITRNSLEEIVKKSSQPSTVLSNEEADALFDALDNDNKGAITAEEFMRALYGENGARCLDERRKRDIEEAAMKAKAKKEADVAARAESEQKVKQETKAVAAAAKSGAAENAKKKKACCGC